MLLPAIADNVFQISAEKFGFLETLIAIGSLLGAITVSIIKYTDKLRVGSLGLIVTGILFSFLVFLKGFAAYAMLILMGFSISFITVILMTLAQDYFKENIRGKLTGIFTIALTMFTILGMIISAIIATMISVKNILLIASLILIIAGIVNLLICKSEIRTHDINLKNQ